MRQFAQIQDGKAHWVFSSEKDPVFAPYIKIIEITDLQVQPKEGWLYDEQNGVFVEPPTPQTVALKRLTFKNAPIETGLEAFIYVFDEMNDEVPIHQHSVDHWVYILSGSVEIIDAGIKSQHSSGEMVFLKRGQDHSVTGKVQNTKIVTMFFGN